MDGAEPFGGAFRDRRVLVTGHTGFKGSWLGAWLGELGAETAGYALDPPTDPSLFEAIGLAGRMDHRIGDVRDAAALLAAVDEAQPDVIVHMAAQSLVRRSYCEPAETFATNVMGTVNLLEAVRRIGRPAVVIVVTSDKCYEPAASPRPHAEGDPLGGRDPYSASKGAAEVVAAAYRRSFFDPGCFGDHGVALATARSGNVIGGGDWAADRIVPDAVRALAAGAPVEVRNPDAVRPWQHVLDALGGYLWLAARMTAESRGRPPGTGPCGLDEAWNFGPVPGRTMNVRALVERLLAAWGEGSWRDCREPNAPHETPALELSIDKARDRLGWEPVWSLDDAIDATVAWYRAAAEGGRDLHALTVEQIRGYAVRAGRAWAARAGIVT